MADNPSPSFSRRRVAQLAISGSGRLSSEERAVLAPAPVIRRSWSGTAQRLHLAQEHTAWLAPVAQVSPPAGMGAVEQSSPRIAAFADRDETHLTPAGLRQRAGGRTLAAEIDTSLIPRARRESFKTLETLGILQSGIRESKANLAVRLGDRPSVFGL
jgi:hypothetical protein